ncbi:MAG: hypothetical protein POH28_00555 [Acidocella sp.]|nr:hypothetical protein [Acidocella sp.]
MTHSAPKLAVKSAWKLLVASLGGVDATAACVRCSRSLISEYGNRASDRFPPANAILEAEEVASEPFVTAALARALGYELVMVTPPRGHGELAVIIAALSRDVGELFATAAHALGHETLSKSELADLLREFGDAHRVTGEALALLHKRSGEVSNGL